MSTKVVKFEEGHDSPVEAEAAPGAAELDETGIAKTDDETETAGTDDEIEVANVDAELLFDDERAFVTLMAEM